MHILGYGVHKIRENVFESIVTLTRFFGVCDRVEVEKNEIKVAQ